jgi:glutamate-1-semialdehyde 2,1-aminomutase
MILNEGYSTKYFSEKGEGSRVIIDKKSFYDLSYCNGVLFLGHNSSVFKKTLKYFLKNKISIFSNPNIHAVNLAKTVKFFFSNFSKIIFCNTGAESVIKALRISRAINHKKIIVCVTGSWHGSVDQTLFSSKKNLEPIAISSGLKNEDQKNIKFIPYNDIKNSKKILDKYRKSISCILIEPVISSLPSKDIKPFLKFIEIYTKQNKILLIFDEIISCFRIEKGSVQKKFNIKPDITLIGKILGGGFPISAIGISSKVYKKIQKLKTKIFFGGTFSGNTFSTLAGNNTISYIKKNTKLVNNLIKKCEFFENKVNNFIIKNNIDAKVYRFDTIMRIVFSKNKVNNRIQRDFFERKKSNSKNNFIKFLRKKNILYPRSGAILLSLANNIGDLNYIIDNVCIGLKKNFS